MQIDGKAVTSDTTVSNIALKPVVTIVFSQDMPVATLKSANKVTLKQGTIAKALTITQGGNNKTIIITPTSPLVNSRAYTLMIAKDLIVKIGEKTYKLSTDAVFKFTTIATTTTNTYTVMFNVEGGSAVASLENIPNNTSITKPTDPTKANNTFVNWFKDSAKTMVFDFSSETITANITLYAKWEAVTVSTTYTVMFNVDGGSPVDTIENIPQNTSITKPTAPTKANNTFVNWFKDSGKTMVFNFSSETITANITLYAKWELVATNTFTVTFNLNYTPSTPITQTVNSGTTATRETPTRTNYNFIDWFENENLTGTPFDFVTEINANKTLYAKWGIITYTVTFDLNYTPSTPISQTINSGTIATKETPTRTDYNFVDWFENENLTGTPFDFTAQISSDKTLYAKWEIITYIVTFSYVRDGGNISRDGYPVNSGTRVVKYIPTRTNYSFVDWYVNQDFSGTPFDFTTEIRADKTLYAKWTSSPVVTFNTLVGSEIASQIIERGEVNAPNPAPTRTYYTLEGWYESEQLTGSKVIFPKTISTSITLYAKWTRIAYRITFDLNYDAALPGGTENSNQEGKVTKIAPTRLNYAFIGWFTETTGDTKIDLASHVFNSATILYAHWSFSITFNENYGDNPAEEIVQTNPIDNKVTKADPTRARYTFSGWFTAETGGTKVELTEKVFDAPITLYAQWTKIAYTVTYDLNYENAPDGGIEKTNQEGRVTKADPIRPHYIFTGWFTDATLYNDIRGDNVFHSSTTVYAGWRRIAYRVTFDLNYNNAPSGGTADSNQEGKVIKADPIRTHYTFNGWFTETTGGTKVELNMKIFNSATTLHAQWTREAYRVTFDLNYENALSGGTADSNQEGKVTKDNPIRTHYTFNGWFTETIGGTKVELAMKIFNSATTLYAQWTREAYRVTFNLNYENALEGGTLESNQEGKVTKADPIRSNYTFNGWFIADIGGTKIDLTMEVFDSATALYAQWTRETYRVTFNLNYNAAPDGGTADTNQAGRVIKVNPARDGYTFNGWFTEDTGGTKVELTMKVFDSATTLYAQWIVEGKANSLSVSITAVASSIELSITCSLALSDIGAVIRLATESAPTKTEAMASAGYVALTVPANEGRKFSISQHYGSDFTDGLTLADVLTPNTAYKLYLYFPVNSISTATTEITGISLTGNIGEATFTTASLPTEGDAIWTSQLVARKFVSSLDNLYYMEAQTAVAVVYFKIPSPLVLSVLSNLDNDATALEIGSKDATSLNSYFKYVEPTGDISSYFYWIVADKLKKIYKKIDTDAYASDGSQISFTIPVTRY